MTTKRRCPGKKKQDTTLTSPRFSHTQRFFSHTLTQRFSHTLTQRFSLTQPRSSLPFFSCPLHRFFSYHDGVAGDHAAHGVDVDLAGLLFDGGVEDLDAKVVSGLIEGGVRGDRDDHLRLGDALGLAGPVAPGLDGHEDALGAARGGGAARLGPAVVHVDDHGDDLGLHLAHARVNVRVERVGEGELVVGMGGEAAEVLAAVVDGAGHLSLLDGLDGEGVEDLELAVNLLLGESLGR